MTGATPASPKRSVSRSPRLRSVPPRPRSDRGSTVRSLAGSYRETYDCAGPTRGVVAGRARDIQCRTPMINGALRTSRRRFLTQVGAAGFGIAVPVSTMMAQETQRSFVGDGKEVSLGEKLARYATSLRYEDLPEEVIRIAKRTILDTLGCAFGGYSAGPSKIAMKLASDVNSKQPGTILLSGIKTSPELAVFANGVMIRYLDFNDAYVSQMNGAGHPSDTIAALLTASELRQRSGRELITATVLAYEVYCKIGDVFDYLGHGIDHTTVTGMGAVVGAGKLLGLTPEEMVHAVGITVGGNTATRQGRADTLSNWKAYAAADACRKSIFSVQLAGNGRTGPSNVFEGRYGFFKVMSRKPVAPHSSVSRSASVVMIRYLDFNDAYVSQMNGAGHLLHQAFSTWPIFPNCRASRRGSKVVFQEPGRNLRGQHPCVPLRHQDHGRRTGQVEAADARNRRSQHPVFGGPGAHVWQDRSGLLRGSLFARRTTARPR